MSFYTRYKKSFSVYMGALVAGALLSGLFVRESKGGHEWGERESKREGALIDPGATFRAHLLGLAVIRNKGQDADGNLYAILKHYNNKEWIDMFGAEAPGASQVEGLRGFAFLDKTRAGSTDIYEGKGNIYNSVVFLPADGKATLLSQAKFKYGDLNTTQVYYGFNKDGADPLASIQVGAAGVFLGLRSGEGASDLYGGQGKVGLGKSDPLALTLGLSDDVSLKASLPSDAASQDDPLDHYEFYYDDKIPVAAVYEDGTTAHLKVKDVNNFVANDKLKGVFGGFLSYAATGKENIVPAAIEEMKYDETKGFWQMKVAVKKGGDLSGAKVKSVILFPKAPMKGKTGLLKKRTKASK